VVKVLDTRDQRDVAVFAIGTAGVSRDRYVEQGTRMFDFRIVR